MNPRVVFAALAGVGLLLSGCSGSSSDPAGCTYDQTYGGVHVSGSGGQEPTITLAADAQPATELGVVELCPGNGTPVTQSSILTVDYTGVPLSTGVAFDSTYAGGEPLTFALGSVLPGWQQGLLDVVEGETVLLVIPPDLAYGAQSPGPGIGPNETLVFVVDLIAVQ